jgi:hypothetical protein
MSPKLSPRAGFLMAGLATVLCAIWIPIFAAIFREPLEYWALLYLIACPILLIAALGAVRRLLGGAIKKSGLQKAAFFGAIPLLALVLWLGLITGHRLVGAVLWYLGNLVVAGYFFLGPGSARAPRE